MSPRGFWNKTNAVNKKDRSELRARPQPPTVPEGSWHDHPDRDAVARAERALCTLPKVSHRDS